MGLSLRCTVVSINCISIPISEGHICAPSSISLRHGGAINYLGNAAVRASTYISRGMRSDSSHRVQTVRKSQERKYAFKGSQEMSGNFVET